MIDVAREAGVSLKTVSRVVNGEPGVLEATAVRVQEAVTRLGFRRNEAARNLRRGVSTTSIGLIIEDIANPFYSALARAVEQVAREHGHQLLLGSSEEEPDRERELFTAFASRRVAGLVIVPCSDDHRYIVDELKLGTAAVFVDRPPSRLSADAVLSDNVGGARTAVEHLFAHGHSRIAVLGDRPGLYTTSERVRGVRAALADAGIDIAERLVRIGLPHEQEAEQAAVELLTAPDPPTAFFALNNRMTLGVLRAMRRTGESVALVGFDDFELADLLHPAVTVVAQDPSALGERAAQLLFDRIHGDTRPAERVTLPTELIVRGSGESPV